MQLKAYIHQHLIIYIACTMCMLMMLVGCTEQKPQYVIGVSQCSEDNWRAKINTELTTAAYSKGNIQLKIVSANDDNQTQIRQIEQFVEEGVDLIIVAPNQVKRVNTALQKARKQGIPVVCIDRKSSASLYDAFIGADNYEAGRITAEYLAKRMGGKGTLVEFQGLDGSSPALERHQGVLHALKQYPDIRLVDGGYTDWTTQGAMKVVHNFREQHPERVDAILGHNDRIALAAAQVYTEDGHRPYTTGIDALATDDGGIRSVADGKIDATYIYPTRGDLVIDLACRILARQPYESETLLSSTLVTKENAEAMLSLSDDMDQMQARIADMRSQIDTFTERIDAQRALVQLAAVTVLLLVFIVVYVYREQVRKRQRAVAETNERLRFFTNVCHEFRTPLTLIADPLQRIEQSGQLNGEMQGLLSVARRQASVMMELADQILDLRKLQNRKMQVWLTEADMAEKVRTWADSFAPHAESRGVKVMVSVPDHLRVLTDVGKLERVCYNLVANALKHSPKDSTVTIGAGKDMGRLTLYVSDEGHGIPRQEQKRIFDRFYQTKSEDTGTGIGLALVSELVKVMEGKVTVESREGVGTTFSVSIPLQLKGELADTQNEQANMPATISDTVADNDPVHTSADNAETMILVVDDNVEVRKYVSQLLKQAGYQVVQAADGAEGVMKATQEVPDLVVSDVMMPVMNGHEMCRKLKSQPLTCHIPILLLTAQTMDDQRADGYDVGADAYVTKPFASRVLLSRIDNLLRSRQQLKDIFSKQNEAPHVEVAIASGAALQYSAGLAAASEATEAMSAEPTGPEPTVAEKAEHVFVTQFRDLVDKHLTDSDFSVEALSAEMGLSRVQMYRKIKALTGRNPVELIREERLIRADELLRSGEYTVSEVAYKTGFSSPSYFTKCYREHFGHTPKQ